MTITEQLYEALRDARAAIRATHIHSTALDIINEALAAYEASKVEWTRDGNKVTWRGGAVLDPRTQAAVEGFEARFEQNHACDETSKSTMGAGSVQSPSTEDDGRLIAPCEPVPSTPAQGQDIEGLVHAMCQAYQEANPAHEIASWKGMRAALVAVQQKHWILDWDIEELAEEALRAHRLWDDELSFAGMQGAILAVLQKLNKPVPVRKYVPLPFDAEGE